MHDRTKYHGVTLANRCRGRRAGARSLGQNTSSAQTAVLAWIHVDVTREDGATAGQSAYVRVEVPASEPEPEPEPVPAIPLLGQLLLALGLLRLGVMRLSRLGGAAT